MRFTKLALYAALLSPVALVPAYGRGGGGGGGAHGGGGGHFSGGAHFSGGSVRGGYVGGYRGGYAGGYRGGYYGGRGFYYGGRGFYWSPGFYVLGGWTYPWPNYYAPYYAYDPYYYDDPYYYGYQVQAPATSSQPYPQYPASQYPAPGQTAPAPAPQQPQAQANAANPQDNYFMIEFKDHTIQLATAYKVDGDQLHWITRQGEEKQAPVSSVDIPASEKLNRDRNVEFKIP